MFCLCLVFFFQAEDGIRDLVRSRGLGDVYKRQEEMLRGLNDGKLDLCLLVQPAAKALRGLKFELLREYATCVAVSLSLIHI